MLDTNICIYIINNKPPAVRAQFLQHPQGSLGLSSIMVAELVYGVSKSESKTRDLAALEKFLADFEILPFETEAAYRYGELKLQLERKGKTIGPFDLQIAAHALSLNATLVSNNLKEFKQVKGLKLEKWFG